MIQKKILKVSYPINFVDAQKNIPIFSPRSKNERAKDKYDKDFQFVDYYTGVMAFGSKTLNNGGTEGLYRTINEIILSNLERNAELTFLDIGCGVGRTIYDLAEKYERSSFIGLDYAYNMLIRANQVLLGGEKFSIDLSNKGWGKLPFQGKKSTYNVELMQATALDLPFRSNIFDCVISTFLIDRVPNPQKCIKQAIKVLKSGGFFILTNPLDFESANNWEQFRDTKSVVDFIKNNDIEIQGCFDNLPVKVLMESRGNYMDFNTLIIYGMKI